MNIRHLVASGILGAASLLTGCDAYKNTQKAFSQTFIEDSTAKKDQEAFNKQLDDQRRQIEAQKQVRVSAKHTQTSPLEHMVDKYVDAGHRGDALERKEQAFNGFVAEVPEAEPLAIFKGYENPIYAKHDATIRKAVNKWNAHYQGVKQFTPLKPETVKAIMLVESGSIKDLASWLNDPMSLAHAGDVGFEDLVKKDCEHLVPGNAYLGTLQRTPRKNKNWDYSFKPIDGRHKITAEESIDAGVQLLIKKGLVFKIGPQGPVVPEFGGWDKAIKNYNGGGDTNYVQKVEQKLQSRIVK